MVRLTLRTTLGFGTLAEHSRLTLCFVGGSGSRTIGGMDYPICWVEITHKSHLSWDSQRKLLRTLWLNMVVPRLVGLSKVFDYPMDLEPFH